MIIKFFRERRFIIGIILLIFIHALINLVWLKKDTFPLWFDYGEYFQRSIQMFYASQNNTIDFVKALLGLAEYKKSFLPYRLLLPVSSLPWYYIFGLNPDIAVMSCTLFLALALFFTYKIGAFIFDRKTAILAAFVLSVSPGFFLLYRRYSPAFAVTAIVASAIYCLLRSQNFKNRLYSGLFGISVGIGMLTKEFIFAFLPGVFFYTLYKGGIFRPYSKEQKTALVNLLISLIITGIIVVPIYWLHKEMVLNRIFDIAYSSEIQHKFKMVSPYRFEGFKFYPLQLFHETFLPFYSIWFIFGIILLFKKNINKRWFLIWWIFSSFILLCSTKTRAFEYTTPLLIPIALIASYGINNIAKSALKKRFLIVLVVFWGTFQLLLGTFPVSVRLTRLFYGPNNFSANEFNTCHPISKNWQLEEIIEYIISNKKEVKGEELVYVSANSHAISTCTLSYVAEQKKAKLIFSGYGLSIKDALSYNFILVKSGEKQGIFCSPERVNKLIKKVKESANFKKLPKEFILPDKSSIVIYKRIVS